MGVVNSPVHDLLIRIKNAYMARKDEVTNVIHSRHKEDVLNLLKRYSFIKDYEVEEPSKGRKFLKVKLYEVNDDQNDMIDVKFYSKPSKRWYLPCEKLPKVAWGRGIWIITTSKGVMASHEAYKQRIWGELIAEVY